MDAHVYILSLLSISSLSLSLSLFRALAASCVASRPTRDPHFKALVRSRASSPHADDLANDTRSHRTRVSPHSHTRTRVCVSACVRARIRSLSSSRPRSLFPSASGIAHCTIAPSSTVRPTAFLRVVSPRADGSPAHTHAATHSFSTRREPEKSRASSLFSSLIRVETSRRTNRFNPLLA